MQVLSRVFNPLLACRWPLRSPPRHPVEVETTQSPAGPGAWMHPRDVQVRAAGQPMWDRLSGGFNPLPRAHGRHTCVVNNFVWKDPKSDPPEAIAAFYAKRIAQPGTFGGYLEAEALGNLLGVRVGLWDRPRGYYRWLSTQGVDAPEAPCVHVVNLAGLHWCALVPPESAGAPWMQRDAGGHGDCLFHAVRAAWAAHPCRPEVASASQLRLACAEELRNPVYQERIISMSEQAWDEYRSASRWRRLRLRFF